MEKQWTQQFLVNRYDKSKYDNHNIEEGEEDHEEEEEPRIKYQQINGNIQELIKLGDRISILTATTKFLVGPNLCINGLKIFSLFILLFCLGNRDNLWRHLYTRYSRKFDNNLETLQPYSHDNATIHCSRLT